MRIVSLLTVALVFTACPDDGTNRLPVDLGTEADTGDVDTTDVGTEIEDDTDPDTDTGVTGVASDCHAADPLDKTGWSRTYETNYEGTVGTEIQTPGGLGTAPNGESAYIVNSVITPTGGTNPIELTSYRNCSNGEALWLGEDVSGTAEIELIPGSGIVLPSSLNATRSLESGAIYLPTLAQLETGALINYDYEIMITKEGDDLSAIFEIFGGGGGGLPNCMTVPGLPENDAQCIRVEGELTVIGSGNRDVNGTTWFAYQVIDIRTELWSEAGGGAAGGAGGIPGIGDIFGDLFGFGGSSDKTTTRQIWYVDGIGIVEEKAFDTTAQQGGAGGQPSDDDLIVTRKLTSFSGL